MNKVFVLLITGTYGDGDELIGVYSTKEKAEERKAQFHVLSQSNMYIEAHEVDSE